MKGECIKVYVLQLGSGRTFNQTCEDRRWYLSNKPALDWSSMRSVEASKTVPVTDGAAPAAERLAWGGNLWLWRQWRRRWRIQAGKPPTLFLWLLYSSQDSRPHPEKQNQTRLHSPGSLNTFLLFDVTWKQGNKRQLIAHSDWELLVTSYRPTYITVADKDMMKKSGQKRQIFWFPPEQTALADPAGTSLGLWSCTRGQSLCGWRCISLKIPNRDKIKSSEPKKRCSACRTTVYVWIDPNPTGG